MRTPRQCCRPGCASPAVATLTFVYAESTAVIGPLAIVDEPHSWDLCEHHASRITVPRGWDMLRSTGPLTAATARDEDDLTALAEAVREATGGQSVRSATFPAPVVDRGHGDGDFPHQVRPGADGPSDAQRPAPLRPRPGRRGHLRVLPDPVE